MSSEHESDVERTPAQPPRRSRHTIPTSGSGECIEREEFEDLREDVRQIKHALIGRNQLKPDPNSLVMRVNAQDQDLKDIKETVNGAKRLGWTAIVGFLGMLFLSMWEWIKAGGLHVK